MTTIRLGSGAVAAELVQSPLPVQHDEVSAVTAATDEAVPQQGDIGSRFGGAVDKVEGAAAEVIDKVKDTLHGK